MQSSMLRIAVRMTVLGLLGLLALPLALTAVEQSPAWAPARAPEAQEAPMRLVESEGLPALHSWPMAGLSDVQPIFDWNLAGNLPLRDGIVRALPAARSVSFPAELLVSSRDRLAGGALSRLPGSDALVWGFSLRVESAWRLRAQLADVELPAGAQLWVYGESGESVGPFGKELVAPDGTLWTPSVAGSEIRVELLLPESAWSGDEAPSLRIRGVSELFPLDEEGRPELGGGFSTADNSCVRDAACVGSGEFSSISSFNRAVAHLQFQTNQGGFICTGALVNDTVGGGFIPYLLTAHHCFSTQGVASTLEAYFDYIRNGCGGSTPSLGSLPRTLGSTLLATSATNDMTFVRLSQQPSGSRSYLGWTTTDPTNGTPLHRVSHPEGVPASYSRSTKVSNPGEPCDGLPASAFHYTDPQTGGTLGGSSGGSMVTDDGLIVGQLYGTCGPNPDDGCDYSNYQVDGKFSVTYPMVQQWLNPGGGGGSCTVGSIASGQTVNGSWSSGCASTHRTGSYARFYAFTLSQSAQVQIDLTSSVDTYLFLLSGSGTNGSVIESDDDGGSGTNSQIVRTLSAGTYTIEATTFDSSTTGNFSLTLTGGGGGGGGCTPDSTTLCISAHGHLWKATMSWSRGSQGGQAVAVPLDDSGITQGGAFSFGNVSNPEVLLKVLNFCALGGSSYAVFFAATTDAGFTLRVEDADSGAFEVYSNSEFHPADPVQDSSTSFFCD